MSTAARRPRPAISQSPLSGRYYTLKISADNPGLARSPLARQWTQRPGGKDICFITTALEELAGSFLVCTGLPDSCFESGVHLLAQRLNKWDVKMLRQQRL
ncbi:hypothetical protein V5799_015378 [Amblyomma americanum]|uniref:Uncharacterized protein n=1 Tax=Amblyomma americanum TaxID=6943 RepID=A0AAQ4E0B8_AMBAM